MLTQMISTRWYYVAKPHQSRKEVTIKWGVHVNFVEFWYKSTRMIVNPSIFDVCKRKIFLGKETKRINFLKWSRILELNGRNLVANLKILMLLGLLRWYVRVNCKLVFKMLQHALRDICTDIHPFMLGCKKLV